MSRFQAMCVCVWPRKPYVSETLLNFVTSEAQQNTTSDMFTSPSKNRIAIK